MKIDKNFPFAVSQEQADAIRAEALRQDMSASLLIRRALQKAKIIPKDKSK